ncbi:MAG: hopanoid-associated sugar epimerase [Alphaproteobacteria bacterium]
MTALVTGATGFVGAAVARRVLAAGEAVRALVRETSDRRNLDGLDVEVAIGDLAAPETLRAALRGCSALFHVAADYRIWCPDPAPMMAANVEGTRTIMRAAAEAGVARIVYTSSVAVLGLHADRSAADEDTASSLGDMIGPYKRSKFLAERVVDTMVRDDGLPAVIVNPSMPVGPRDIKPTPTGRMIVEAAAGRMPAYVETGLNVVHVDDVAEGHWLAYERGEVGRRYILGGENMGLQTILGEVAALVGRRPPRIKLPHGVVLPIAVVAEALARLGGGKREPMATVDGVRMARKWMFFSSDRAVRELGYAPRPAADAFADAVAWFRDHDYF